VEEPTQERTGWVNVYDDGSNDFIHQSKKEADRNSASFRIACVEIKYSFKKGQGL
jgi:hypothetical protein